MVDLSDKMFNQVKAVCSPSVLMLSEGIMYTTCHLPPNFSFICEQEERKARKITKETIVFFMMIYFYFQIGMHINNTYLSGSDQTAPFATIADSGIGITAARLQILTTAKT